MLALIGKGVLWCLGILCVRGALPLALREVFEVGPGAATKYRVASFIRWMAHSLTFGSANLKELHCALDVLLCGNQIRAMPSGSGGQERFWRLGHDLAIEIRRRQGELGVEHLWFADTYEEACTFLQVAEQRTDLLPSQSGLSVVDTATPAPNVPAVDDKKTDHQT